MRLNNILAGIIAIGVVSVQASLFTNDVRNSPPTLVDVLRQRYFSIEDALWHTIDSGMDLSQVLQQIHSGHRTFLRDNFLERNCYFSTFDPDQKVLHDAIKKINQLVERTVDNYLHASRIRFRESDSLAISARNQNLTNELDKLFEITGTTDFYSTIRNVSVRLCNIIGILRFWSCNCFFIFSFSLFFLFLIHIRIHTSYSFIHTRAFLSMCIKQKQQLTSPYYQLRAF